MAGVDQAALVIVFYRTTISCDQYINGTVCVQSFDRQQFSHSLDEKQM